MNQQPDKFFRDKLGGYRPAVSAEGWSRVAGNLGSKSNQRIWSKIAAGLLLLAAAGIIIFTSEMGSPARIASGQSPTKTKGSSPEKETITPGPKLPDRKQAAPVAPQVTVDRSGAKEKRKRERKEPASTTVNKNAAKNDHLEKVENQNVAQAETVEQKMPDGNKDVAVNQTTRGKSVTLVFSAQEVNEKYLTKKNAVAEATSEVKETSTWRKLLDKANDLKHNQDPLGDLRQKKNEILALNFKIHKQSHENQ